jgi:XPG domain containing
MGVKGWNRFLAEEGWIPDHTNGPCCSTSLFCELPNTTASTTSNTPTAEQKRSPRFIPEHSEFHVDGNGLCFHLVETAYARHMNTILFGKWNHHQCPCIHTTPLQLTAQQARHLNPAFIPLKLIADVTSEFVTTLQNDHNVSLFIYWDGSERYVYKQDTDQKRRNDRNEDWNNLHQYCLHGTLPLFNHRSKTSSCEYFLKQFPLSKLYSAQIFHTLHSTYKLPCVQCPNEADAILAQQVSQKQSSYIIAFDSDFCFFSHVQYIPIKTIQIKKSHTEKGSLFAQVLSRELLAESFRFPDSDAMVELAILLGNDYISQSTVKNSHSWINGMNSSITHGEVNNVLPRNRGSDHWLVIFNDIVSFLQNQNAGFRLCSACSETEKKVHFVRQLYNLKLSEISSSVVTSYVLSNIAASQDDSCNATQALRPHVTDAELDTLNINIESSQETIKEAIINSLQVHVNNCVVHTSKNENEPLPASNGLRCIQQEHVLALVELSLPENQLNKDMDDGSMSNTWRPLWADVIAVYMIEKIVLRIYERYWHKNSAHDYSLDPPCAIFDPYKYLLQLCIMRNKVVTMPAAPEMKSDMQKEKSCMSNDDSLDPIGNHTLNDNFIKRPALPVDEFESVILNSIYKNRITIIQGETGCGKRLLCLESIFEDVANLNVFLSCRKII